MCTCMGCLLACLLGCLYVCLLVFGMGFFYPQFFMCFMQAEAAEYGIDPHGQLPDEDEDTVASVSVPDTVCPYQLSADQWDYFHQQVTFGLQDFNASDIFDDSAYLRGLDILHDFYQEFL